MSYLMNNYKKTSFTITHGNASTVFDDSGKQYLDFTAGIAVCALGHNHPKITNAITAQAQKLLHVSNLFATENDELLAEKLCKSSGFANVFFANSGAEANEGAIKLARKYSFDKYGEGRHEIITLTNSFHGRTLAALTATGQDKFHKYFMPFPEGFLYAETNNLQSLNEQISDKTCAIMIELCQGEGGVTPLDKNYVAELYKICEQKDILLIVDEIQTGIGRTGKLFAYEHFGILPDIVTLAKALGGGLPIGAILAGEKCKNTFCYGDHGSTFGGNPLCTAAALAVIDTLDEAFLAEVTKKGEYLKAKIKALNCPNIKEVRGIGLMLGFELDGIENTSVYTAAMEQGLLVLTAGQNTVRLLPPLIITETEIDKCIQILDNILKEKAS